MPVLIASFAAYESAWLLLCIFFFFPVAIIRREQILLLSFAAFVGILSFVYFETQIHKPIQEIGENERIIWTDNYRH